MSLLGPSAQVNHRCRQQGQRGQHQACRPRALLREPHQRSWAFRAQHHEGTGSQLYLLCPSWRPIAHLVNHGVAHELIVLQIPVLLLEVPTDDSVEIAVSFTRELGAFLQENSPKANATVFERFRALLNEGSISHRVQYMIEVLMQVRKDKNKDDPICQKDPTL